MYRLEVYVTNASLRINQTFSYLSKEAVNAFVRVRIDFNHSKTTGIVIDCKPYVQAEKDYQLKTIIEVLDQEPILNNEQYELAKWLAYTTVSPFITCLNSMLPKPLKTGKQLLSAPKEEIIIINDHKIKLTAKQQKIYDQLENGMKASAARKLSPYIITKLADLGVISFKTVEKTYQETGLSIKESTKTLTAKQQEVVKGFLSSDKAVSLLYGVTGSGKTEVYLQLAANYLKKGETVLILVPEIALTPMMIKRVKERFLDAVFYHSGLSDQEKYLQYKRILKDEVRIVVGTRSAVFLPIKKLGLIIIDEEHDNSYKQDRTPCYNAINVAIARLHHHQGRLLLASATPSLEAFSRAKKGEYGFFCLNERINHHPPEIKLIDMQHNKKLINGLFAKEMVDELAKVLSQGQQAMILLNRRGYATTVQCSECNTTLMCRDCDCALTYHQDERLLKCHHCSRTYRIPKYCPVCGKGSLVFQGFGTKRIEEELHKLFNQARICRLDRDSTAEKNAHAKLLNAFENKEYDIMIGTQMIAKGLDFKDVTLVGVLGSDNGLLHQDYNSAKMTFDLLMQAAGRSGRADLKGQVLIQTSNQDHYVFKALRANDYEYFYRIEMNYRSKTAYPPYSHLLAFYLSDHNPERLATSSALLYQLLSQGEVKVYPPFELGRLQGKHRMRLLLSDRSLAKLLGLADKVVYEYFKERSVSDLKVDPDPLYL